MRENILITVKYFNLFDYPLKKEELWQWLFNYENIERLKDKKNQFEDELVNLTKNKVLEEKDGYYFLPGKKDLIKIRHKRKEISLKKIKKAQKISKILAVVPGVKMIAVVSNLGYLNADEEADIDLFIVTAKNKIWSVRFWCVMLMKLLNQRPNRKTTKNKICLSYFVSEGNLDLRQTAIKEPDIHLVYLLAQYLLIYDEKDYWQKYIQANQWIKQYLVNFDYNNEATKFLIKTKTAYLKELIGKTEFGFENKLYKNIQLALMASELQRARERNDKKVIINDKMLKLHVNDKREEINKKIINYKL